MNRRNFIKAVPVLAGSTILLEASFEDKLNPPTIFPELKDSDYKYFVNCYIQNQKYWPLEEYRKGSFGERSFKINQSVSGERWIDGKLRFYGFGKAVDFIDMHSLVVPFYNEALYEVFHEVSKDPMVPPKHIYNYWVKLEKDKLPETIRWVHPNYVDYESDGALIEYV